MAKKSTKKRVPKTGMEAMTAMLNARYSYQAISVAVEEFGPVKISRSMLCLVYNGKRVMQPEMDKALVRAAKALEVKVIV